MSVNDAISKEFSSLKYTSVNHLSSILSKGKGAYLVKSGIKEAYRMMPVHPDDQPLLRVLWDGRIFIDKMLPFGLQSAPIIFSVVAEHYSGF